MNAKSTKELEYSFVWFNFSAVLWFYHAILYYILFFFLPGWYIVKSSLLFYVCQHYISVKEDIGRESRRTVAGLKF